MSDRTGISWTDSTFNPWMGCTKVSPACDHCYAERDTRRFGRVEWGAGKPRVRTVASTWAKPSAWNDRPFWQCDCGLRIDDRDLGEDGACPRCDKPCTHERHITRRRVFSASLADWLDNEVPIEWLVDFLDLIRRTPNLDWLLLTKRIGNWRGRLVEAMECARLEKPLCDSPPVVVFIVEWLNGTPPDNVWLGATVINQAEAERDVTKLLAVPARVRFLSIEPMLGPISLRPDFVTRWPNRQADVHSSCPPLDWIIVGGESGPRARPMHPDWVRALHDQCAAAGVPLHFKQWGEWREDDGTSGADGITGALRAEQRGKHVFEDGTTVYRYGVDAAGRLLDGLEHNGYPQA